MKQLFAIYKKEFWGYLNSLSSYIVIAVFLAVSNFFFFRSFFLAGQASMRAYFNLLPWFFLFLMPAISMRMWADEKKQGTDELLHTWPVREWQPVMAKILAAISYIALILALTITVPMSISQFGNADNGVIFAGYVGALLLAGAFLSVGSWISSFTDNQIVAFIVSIAANFFLMIIGEDFISTFFPSFFGKALNYIGLNSHISSVARGVVDTRDLIYYASIIAIFALLTVLRVKRRA